MTIQQRDGWPAAGPCTTHDAHARAALILGAGRCALWIGRQSDVAAAQALANQHGRADIRFDSVEHIGDGSRYMGAELGGIVVDPTLIYTDRVKIPFSFLLTRVRHRDTSAIISYGGVRSQGKSAGTVEYPDSARTGDFEAVWIDESEDLPPPVKRPTLEERQTRIIELLAAQGWAATWGFRFDGNPSSAYFHLHVGPKILRIRDEQFTLSNYEIVRHVIDMLKAFTPQETSTDG